MPLYNVSASVLRKARICVIVFLQSTLNVPLTIHWQVLEYCEHHRGEPLPTTNADSQDATRNGTSEISKWDQTFIATDQEMLFDIVHAANYLDIKALLSVLVNRTPCHS